MEINVSIAGGAGFVAGELLRVLAGHPSVRLASVLSSSQTGAALSTVHDGLEELEAMTFAGEVAEETDVLFLCLPHGESGSFLASHRLPPDCTIIDLGRDHRCESGDGFVYGLPEAARERLRGVRPAGLHVANPGCFATAIQLGLLPLMQQGMLHGDVHTSAITGSTGAGRSSLPTLHYSWRHDNVQAYQVFTHAHLEEIRATMNRLQPGYAGRHYFIPYRGPFTRGIIASSHTTCDRSTDELRTLYRAAYAEHPFVTVTDGNPSIKQVVNTNHCLLTVAAIDGMCVVTTVIDNLLKGAAGQAVQNMNLLFGLDERSGLRLQASAY
jgi:N-acetyl-gamma-glutamyl-phosphate reductase